MKLYFDPRSRSIVAKWMLDELGEPYETVLTLLEDKAHKKPDYLKINPAGKLPALVDGEARVFENAAICIYLADKFPARRLAPPQGSPDRGRYLSLMVYSTAQLEPAIGDELSQSKGDISARGWTDAETARDVVETELGDGPYLFGDQFTAADVMIGSMFIWMRIMGKPSGRPKIDAYVDRLLARPAGIKLPGKS